jgi:hypothetical protein
VVGVKTARIYTELAAHAQAKGYERVTAAAVHDWRKRGMLPSARGLGRSKRRPGRIPQPLRDRALAICTYHYDRKVADLRIVTLLLWLDGADIPPEHIRRALPACRGQVERLVAMVGSSARRADPEDPDADVDATASVLASAAEALAFDGEAAAWDERQAASFDALRLALGRGSPEDLTDLSPLAMTLGLGRAHSEAASGLPPWLAVDSSAALSDALTALFGMSTSQAIAETSDDDLLRARSTTRGLAEVFAVMHALQTVLPPGDARFGFLRAQQERPEFPAGLLYVAVVRPSEAAFLASAFTAEQLAEWKVASNAVSAWAEEHPELEADIASRGTLAVLEQWTNDNRDGSAGARVSPMGLRRDDGPGAG